MPSTTFEKLPSEKKERILSALLHEFSQYPLTQSQVARIIKEAHISRGAFYKYFADLTDAYTCLYQGSLKEIHAGLSVRAPLSKETVGLYVNSVKDFLENAAKSPYRDLVKMHTLYNAAFLEEKPLPIQASPKMWAVTSLCHQTIRDILLQPKKKNAALKRLEPALSALI